MVNPWSSDSEVVTINVKLSADATEPKYVKSISLIKMDNIDKVEISLLRDGESTLVTEDNVRTTRTIMITNTL